MVFGGEEIDGKAGICKDCTVLLITQNDEPGLTPKRQVGRSNRLMGASSEIPATALFPAPSKTAPWWEFFRFSPDSLRRTRGGGDGVRAAAFGRN